MERNFFFSIEMGKRKKQFAEANKMKRIYKKNNKMNERQDKNKNSHLER